MDNIICVKDVSFKYKNSSDKILDKITFSINKGDFVGIIGANGVGKSTLIKILLGLIRPDTGSIKLFSEDIYYLKDKKKLGYMPQNAISLLAGFPATVNEIVAVNLLSGNKLFRLTKKACKKRVYDVLKSTEMQDFAGHMVSELSGGQQQRVMISKVLVNEPELLILDEPTVGLDSVTIKSLYNLLKNLNTNKKLTILMITHDLIGITKHANRILMLSKDGIEEKRRV